MRRAFLLLPVLSTLLLVRPARAQSEGDVSAYFALTFTPTGAFVPLPTAARLGEPVSSAISFRYGQWSFDDDDAFHNIGISGDFRAGTGRLGLTGGAMVCSGCDPLIMLGADWTTPLVRRGTGDGAFGAGLTTTVGAGIPTSETEGIALSGSLGLPLTMLAGDPGGLRAIPYVTPAIGFGTLTGDDGGSGVRPMIGGGIGLVTANGLGVSVGFQKVFIDGGETIIGVALTLGGR